MPNDQYDVIVVGAGHAGLEAAAASARLGCRTALVSSNLDTVGKMSCNPSVGGVAKGQLAREVDALGGLMGRATDATGIQFRILGRSKGPAMWSPRAQCDKSAYAAWMKHEIESTPGVFPVQGEGWAIETASGVRRPAFGVSGARTSTGFPGVMAANEKEDGDSPLANAERRTPDAERHVIGLRLRDGRLLRAPRVVLTTGTFLQGLLHQGETKTAGGRMGDAPATGLSASLASLGLRLIRHKTGTPCRVHADSIDWSLCSEQPGDAEPQPFSFTTARIIQPQISCWETYSTPEAHAAIRANLSRAPMYNGQIASVGPRYCPSIEDKVMRFADRDRHHIFLEPEGRHTKEIYVNGLSTSLPLDVQDAVLAAIPALRNAHVMRYGYAVEYDVVAPDQIDHRLAVTSIPGLYLGGQINGTSGYEEAAAQGLIAGANAALSLLDREGLVITRGEGYLGVLVDDLVTRCPDEPYRMFTSRAEHRLHLRSDNADRRLTPLAARCGLVDAARARAVADKEAAVQGILATVPDALARRIAGEALEPEATAALVPALAGADAAVAEQVWIELRYSTYLTRQQSTIDRLARQRDLPIPADCDYASIVALSTEGRNRMAKHRPRTLGEAANLPGVRQVDLENLWAWMQNRNRTAANGP